MADPDLKIWDGIMSHLRGQSPNLCRQWFNELEPLGVAGGQFVVRIRSRTSTATISVVSVPR